nr:nitrate regulatory gene2 protein-like [Tanacetum cinerariifolium]
MLCLIVRWHRNRYDNFNFSLFGDKTKVGAWVKVTRMWRTHMCHNQPPWSQYQENFDSYNKYGGNGYTS